LEIKETNENLLDFWAEFENELVYCPWGCNFDDDTERSLFTVQINETSSVRTYRVLGAYTIRITPSEKCVDPAVVQFKARIDYDLSALSAGTREKTYTNYDVFFADVKATHECAWDV
jgi:hypothetical protein